MQKYSCEQICENRCWVSSSGKVEMGDIFGTFISTYKDSHQEEESTPPILESRRCVTLLIATLASFVFLELPSSFQLMNVSTCYSHSVGTVLTALGTAVTLWLKEHLRKVCTGCPLWDYISQRPLCPVEAMKLVLLNGLRANVILGTLFIF